MKTFNTVEEGINYYIDKYQVLNKDEENLRYFRACKVLRFLAKIKWKGLIPTSTEELFKLHTFLVDNGVFNSYQGYGWNGHGGNDKIRLLENSRLTEEDYQKLEG